MPVVAAVVVAADQISKSLVVELLPSGSRLDIIGSFFGFRVTRNPGGIFGFFPQAGLMFLVFTLIVVTVVVVWSLRTGESPVLFGMVVGGGVGNLADRIFRGPNLLAGRVVDFIDFSFWPTFNLADAAISIGVALLLIRSFRLERR